MNVTKAPNTSFSSRFKWFKLFLSISKFLLLLGSCLTLFTDLFGSFHHLSHAVKLSFEVANEAHFENCLLTLFARFTAHFFQALQQICLAFRTGSTSKPNIYHPSSCDLPGVIIAKTCEDINHISSILESFRIYISHILILLIFTIMLPTSASKIPQKHPKKVSFPTCNRPFLPSSATSTGGPKLPPASGHLTRALEPLHVAHGAQLTAPVIRRGPQHETTTPGRFVQKLFLEAGMG